MFKSFMEIFITLVVVLVSLANQTDDLSRFKSHREIRIVMEEYTFCEKPTVIHPNIIL